jgi:threonyl-tRNA synthetase
MKMDHDGMMKAADNAEMAMKSEGMSDADKATMQQQMDNMTETEKTDHMKVSEENVTKLQTACAGNDSMTVMDAMKAQ